MAASVPGIGPAPLGSENRGVGPVTAVHQARRIWPWERLRVSRKSDGGYWGGCGLAWLELLKWRNRAVLAPLMSKIVLTPVVGFG